MRARVWVIWLLLAVLFLVGCEMFEPSPGWVCARNPCNAGVDSTEVPVSNR